MVRVFLLMGVFPLLNGCKILQTQKSQVQITNGREADSRVHAQGVLRIRSFSSGAVSTCTGTLIHTPNEKLNSCVVLSAAHCFKDVPAESRHSIEIVSPQGQVVLASPPTAIHVHPSYKYTGERISPSMSAVDISVVQFPCSTLSGIKASRILDYKNVSVGANLVIAGYGLTMSETQAAMNAERGLASASGQPQTSSVLMQTEMRLRRVDFLDGTAAGVFALAGLDGRSSCNGDSGGPAFFDSEGELFLVGSTSAGPALCEKSTATYAISSVHADWMNSVLGSSVISVVEKPAPRPPQTISTPSSGSAVTPTLPSVSSPQPQPSSTPVQASTSGTKCSGVLLKVQSVTRSWGTILKLIDMDSTQISETSFKCNLKNGAEICLDRSPKPTGTGNSASFLVEPITLEGCEKFIQGRKVYLFRKDFSPKE